MAAPDGFPAVMDSTKAPVFGYYLYLYPLHLPSSVSTWQWMLLWAFEVFLIINVKYCSPENVRASLGSGFVVDCLLSFFITRRLYFQSIDSYHMKSWNLGHVLGSLQLLPIIS